MKCKLCKEEIFDEVKIKNGYICRECYTKLPGCVRNLIDTVTAKHIHDICKIITLKKSQEWASCKNIGLCDESIVVNDWEIKLKDMTSIKLNFHPKQKGMTNPNMVEGLITVIIETKRPHLIIEEPFIKAEIGYKIIGTEIIYSYPEQVVKMLDDVQLLISRGVVNTEALKKQYSETNTNKKTNNTNSTNNTNNTNKRDYTRHGYNKKNAYHSKAKDELSPFDKAKAMFGVEIPFTKEEIKRKRNEMMKKYHPDAGGSTEKSIEINNAFELLMRFTS